MPITIIVTVILVIALLGALPNWRYSARWGYSPSGAIGMMLIIPVVMIVAGSL